MSTDYEILIYREEDYWVAKAPQLIGCACHAASREQALREIEQLIPEWIELARESDYPLPAPARSLVHA